MLLTLTMFILSFAIHLQPLPDTEVRLYESRLVQRKRKQTKSKEEVDQDPGQAAFKVCRKYTVSPRGIHDMKDENQLTFVLSSSFCRCLGTGGPSSGCG